MNTTYSTFRRPVIYTVLSDSAPRVAENSLSVALIPRGDTPLLSPLIEELNKIGPQEILIFNSNFLTHVRSVAVRNIWINEPLSAGELINIAVEEAKSKSVLVLWSDMKLLSSDISAHVFLRIEERGDLCATPQLFSVGDIRLPSLSAPAFDSKGFSVIRDMNNNGETRVFLPLDFAGVYNRARFINMGGYDTTITNPYWQKADFAMRAAMWGERIVLNPALAVAYTQENNLIDDESFDLSCRIFALKNLGVTVDSHRVRLPKRRLLWLHGVRGAWQLFREIREWVYENRFRFRYDAEYIVDNWSK
jgi:hypothetical protein